MTSPALFGFLLCTLPVYAAFAAPPKEFSLFFGKAAQMCQACHGAPPSLPHSDSASRIVPNGALARSGAELRKIMSRKDLAPAMGHVLADSDLTDEKLETIRRYLIDVRDGAVPAKLEFGGMPTGELSEPLSLTIANERPARDAPATIASIKVTGDFVIAAGGTCQPGGPFKGESKCTVIVQFRPKAKGARSGKLEFQLAPTMGLVPQKRIALLAGKGEG